MRSVAVLGSTGSIGRNTLKVLESLGDAYKVVGLAVHSSIDLLEAQARRFRPRLISVADSSAGEVLRQRLADTSIQVVSGPDAAVEVATMPEADLVIASIVGAAGLLPTLAAIEHGKDLAFVNKETLVVGGPLVMNAVRRKGVQLIPVDSEISAIFQCLQGNRRKTDIERVLLTASGGPFRKTPLPNLAEVTVEQALRHPNWDMGAKITIDSATMMNKAFEVIEAKWLFDLSYEQVEIIIHPESIIHSMVEFVDGSLLAQLGVADMRVPIQYALTHPHRQASLTKPLDLIEVGSLHFEPVDPERYPCLEHAYRAMALGGTMPVVLNAANEVAVQAFLQRQIPFLGIPDLIEQIMQQHQVLDDPSLDQVLAVDRWARQAAHASIQAGR